MQNSENITVAVRIRPDNKITDLYISDNSISFLENTNKVQYTFDYVFDQNVNQETVFNTVAKNAIDWVCQGYNSTIFAYGATASGKSYTMFGEKSKNEKGIIPRTCEMLFQNINNNEEVAEAILKCSFLEIYREHIRDLINYKNETEINLKLRQNEMKGVYVQNLVEKYVYSPQDILNTIAEGVLQRTTSSTALNNVSSRSHAVLTLTLTQKLNDGTETVSKLNLIDLAGSENVSKSEVQGTALSEAQTINKSLSCLGNVIYALTEKGREHIPYRDSKLTYLLQDSLGGNSKTILIATINPSLSCMSETLNTLKFAKRAKDIKNIPKINKNESIINLLQTIESLKKRINDLEKGEVIYNQEENHILKLRCERLENNIKIIEDENKIGNEKTKELKELFNKQRDLAKERSKELYNEKIKNYNMKSKIEKYNFLYNSIVEICECNSETIVKILPEILIKFKNTIDEKEN